MISIICKLALLSLKIQNFRFGYSVCAVGYQSQRSIFTERIVSRIYFTFLNMILNHLIQLYSSVHRVGRTARAGRGGCAITLMTPRDVKRIHAIEARIGTQLKEYAIEG